MAEAGDAALASAAALARLRARQELLLDRIAAGEAAAARAHSCEWQGEADGVRQPPGATAMGPPVPRISCRAGLERARAAGEPAVLHGLDWGACVTAWADLSTLSRRVGPRRMVPVHITHSAQLDVAGHRAPGRPLNFTLAQLPFEVFLARASQPRGSEHLYLRSVPDDRRRPACLWEEFPELAADFVPPAGLWEREQEHSSCLRIASAGTRVWPHYDTLPNLLVQVVGAKRISLWPPAAEPYLSVEGSSSRVEDVDAAQGDPRFPLFALAHRWRRELTLEPGEAVFIPPLWFHTTIPVGATAAATADNDAAQAAGVASASAVSVAINVFLHHQRDAAEDPSALWDGSDTFANKDPPAAWRAAAAIEEALKQLRRLPEPFRALFAGRAARQLAQLAASADG